MASWRSRTMLETPIPYAEVSFTKGYEFAQGSGYALPEYPFVVPPELSTGCLLYTSDAADE